MSWLRPSTAGAPLKCLRAVVDRPSLSLAGAVSNARTPRVKRRFLHRSLSDPPNALPCGLGSCEWGGVLNAAKFGQVRCALHRRQKGTTTRVPAATTRATASGNDGGAVLDLYWHGSRRIIPSVVLRVRISPIAIAYRRGIGTNYQLAYPAMALHEFDMVIDRSTE
jgi:hypothetical protein